MLIKVLRSNKDKIYMATILITQKVESSENDRPGKCEQATI